MTPPIKVDLQQTWSELESMKEDRPRFLAHYAPIRFRHLQLFRKGAKDLERKPMIEQVQWEDVIATKGYIIDRTVQPFHEGAVSSSYKARRQFSADILFCKLYQTKKFSEAHSIANLHQQITNLVLFNHDNLVVFEKAFEVINTQKLYLFMPLPGFNNAMDYFAKRKDPLPLAIAKRWVQCILNALAYIHTLGLSHNNVTLSALLLVNEQGDLKLMIPDLYAESFGQSETDVVPGKQNKTYNPYYSFEKMFTKHHDLALNDIWQTGCIHFYTLTLLNPFVRRIEQEFRDDINLKTWAGVGLYDSSPKLDQSTKDLLYNIFDWEPKRWTAIELLHHPYFSS